MGHMLHKILQRLVRYLQSLQLMEIQLDKWYIEYSLCNIVNEENLLGWFSWFSRVPQKFFIYVYDLHIMVLFKCFKHKAPWKFLMKTSLGWISESLTQRIFPVYGITLWCHHYYRTILLLGVGVSPFCWTRSEC